MGHVDISLYVSCVKAVSSPLNVVSIYICNDDPFEEAIEWLRGRFSGQYHRARFVSTVLARCSAEDIGYYLLVYNTI